MNDKVYSAKPLVSIIIPSYNQGRFIRETIESCLSQDYRPIEVIVVDGASRDDTVEILHDYDTVPEVRWLSEPDSGVADAVNKGLALATGEFAGIQSSDDAYLPGAFSQSVEFLQTTPDIGLVYGDWIYVDINGKTIKPHKTAPYSLANFLSNITQIPQHASFFRLSLARDVGGWNSDYFVADTEMWLRMIFKTEARKVDAFWGIRRMHEEQRNRQAAKIVDSWNLMIDKSPDIAKASKNIRKASQCGKYLVAAIYNPGGSELLRFCNYWRAYLSFPEVRNHRNLTSILFPGYNRIKSLQLEIFRHF